MPCTLTLCPPSRQEEPNHTSSSRTRCAQVRSVNRRSDTAVEKIIGLHSQILPVVARDWRSVSRLRDPTPFILWGLEWGFTKGAGHGERIEIEIIMVTTMLDLWYGTGRVD